MDKTRYTAEGVRSAAPMIFAVARGERSSQGMRRRLCSLAEQMEFDTFYDYSSLQHGSIIRVRDCARVFMTMLKKRSEDLAGFSVAKAIRDIASQKPRLDLTPAFFADLMHVLLGLQGRGPGSAPVDEALEPSMLSGRDAAIERSKQLDNLWDRVDGRMADYPHGLLNDVVEARTKRRGKVMQALNASEEDWSDWKWQLRNVIKDADTLGRFVSLASREKEGVEAACRMNIPFGITPYYLTLMDESPSVFDRAVRAQVFPSTDYVRQSAGGRSRNGSDMDFMKERETSPHDLITRRYPAIVVFKPYNTCPQICVYCQRNWEIEGVLASGAMAGDEQVEKAIQWLREHPAVHEVLLTGGDPLCMSDSKLDEILGMIADVPSIERIRIGSRTLATMPMRITENLAGILGRYREPGKREMVVVTHIQHPYEVTPETLKASELIRQQGIPIYNQLVFTFYTSRRFEAAALRRILRLTGISPYYTFSTKGKEETRDYRVPVARLLQEQKEESRLFPGMARTDEAVYNVPGMGKNYLRARQHRSLLSILPDGARVYEYHPWEKNISGTGPLETFITRDVPILEYLDRLDSIGEIVHDYQTIWYYY